MSAAVSINRGRPIAIEGADLPPSISDASFVVKMTAPEQTDLEEFTAPGKTGPLAADRLRSIIERVERLEEERKALASDIKDIFAEAKSAGFDVKVIRVILKERKQEPAEVDEQLTLRDIYRRALGM